MKVLSLVLPNSLSLVPPHFPGLSFSHSPLYSHLLPFLLFVICSARPLLLRFVPNGKCICNRFSEGPNFVNAQLLPGRRDGIRSQVLEQEKKEELA